MGRIPRLPYDDDDDEEERWIRSHGAARKIQRWFRGLRARTKLRALLRSNYVKRREGSGDFVYINKRTGERHSSAPPYLRNEDIELESLEGSLLPGYNPGKSLVRTFALVVNCGNFQSNSISNLPGLAKDHIELQRAILHPLFGKCDSINCVFLQDASLVALRASLASLSSMVAARMNSESDGEEDACELPEPTLFIYLCTYVAQIRDKKRMNNYLLAADSDWSSSNLLKNSSMSLEEFAASVCEIPFRKIFIAAHVAHGTPPEKGSRKTRILYPSPSFYHDLSRLCAGATVLGSARIGAASQVNLSSVLQAEERWFGKRCAFPDPLTAEKDDLRYTNKKLDELSVITSANDAFLSSESCDSNQGNKLKQYYLDDQDEGEEEGLVMAPSHSASMHTHSISAVASLPCGEISYFPDPSPRDIASPGEASIGTPFGNFISSAICGERLSLSYAIAGLDALMLCMSAECASSEWRESTTVVSPDRWNLVEHTLFDRPSPPPSPSVPRLTSASTSKITLQWDDGFGCRDFDGSRPRLWQIERAGVLRNNRDWKAIGWPVGARKFSPPGLVPGVGFFYRVRAWSPGGWSSPGPSSTFIETPELYRPHIALEAHMSNLMRSGGIISILARMERAPHNIDLQRAGIKLICAHASRGGRGRKSLALKAASITCEAMQNFPEDVNVQAGGCFIIAWTADAVLGGEGGVNDMPSAAIACIHAAMQLHNSDSRVVSHGKRALNHID